MASFLNKENLNGFYRYAMALSGNKQDAEDLLHSGIERALKGDFSSVENKPAYIRTIIRNAWYDELRKQKVRKAITAEYNVYEDDDVSDAELPTSIHDENPSEIIIAEIRLERVWSDLQDQQREILYLWCVLGMTAAEMADELKLSRGTVLSRIHRLKLYFQKTHNIANEVKYD